LICSRKWDNGEEKLFHSFALEKIYHTFALAKIEEDSVAQLVEHIPFKDGVLGSSPSWITEMESNCFPFFISVSQYNAAIARKFALYLNLIFILYLRKFTIIL
jgi:hypothetical protein